MTQLRREFPLPLHLTPAYQSLGYPGAGSLPVTEKLVNEILSLPMCAELSEEQVNTVTSAIHEFASQG